MSLINQMLKDLEQRGAGSNDAEKIIQNPLNAVTTAYPAKYAGQETGARFLKISGLMVLLAGGTYLWLQSTPAQSQATNLLNKPSIDNQPKIAASAANSVTPVNQVQVVSNRSAVNAAASNTQENASAHVGSASIFESKLNYTPIEAYTPITKKGSGVVLVNYVPSSTEIENKAQKTLTFETPIPSINSIDAPEKATQITPEKVTVGLKSTATSTDNKSIGKQVRPEQKADNLYRQAIANLQQGRIAEAQMALAQSLEINPANQDVRQTLAGLLLDNKRNDEAKNVLAAGLALAPEQSNFRMVLARLQLEAGDRASAMNTLEQGQMYAKSNADYQSFYATLLQRADRHEEAVSHYNTALAVSSNSATSLVGLGISLQALGKLSNAQDAFTRAQATEALNPELAQFVDTQLKQINLHLTEK